MQTMQEGFELALQNKQVIYGALKKTNIYNTRFDYNDYFQEGMIIYADCYCNYKQDFQIDRFNNYAYQKIVWKILDLLRKEKGYVERHSLDNFENIDFEEVSSVNVVEIFKNLNLTKIEIIILNEHLINGLPLSKLSLECRVSDRYLRKLKNQLKQKLQNEQRR